MKASYLCILIALFMTSCSGKKESSPTQPNAEFGAVLDAYYEDGLRLYPMSATAIGDNRYDDQFPNLLSEEFKGKEKAYYSTYLGR